MIDRMEYKKRLKEHAWCEFLPWELLDKIVEFLKWQHISIPD
jgi:hypothetical protein